MSKTLSEDVRTFTSLFRPFLSPPSSSLQDPSERSCLKKVEHLLAIIEFSLKESIKKSYFFEGDLDFDCIFTAT